MTKKYFIAGNWKMNFSPAQAESFAEKLVEKIPRDTISEVVIAPHFLSLQKIADITKSSSIKLSAQNAYHRDEGAFTGEISANMLKNIAKYVILGHSERRHIFSEDNKLISQKVDAVIRSGMKPILCVGETLLERRNNETSRVLHDQVSSGLRGLTSQEVAKTVIAYEPVWAIGTGDIAKPDQVASAIAKIRGNISALYGLDVADKCRILYGGSATASTAGGYLLIEGVDGLLIGGASLKLSSFSQIVATADKLTQQNEA